MNDELIDAVARQAALARGNSGWSNTPSAEKSICRAYAINASHEAGDAPATPNKRVEELEACLKKLSFAAQTTGGTAGRDGGLCEAIDEAEALLSKTEPPSA